MKLELKHLAPYLPYGFKFISEMDKPYDEFGEVRVWTADGIIKLFGNFCLNTSENNDAYDINFSKPILFPLSSLTKDDIKNFYKFNNDDFKSIDLKEWAEDLMFFIKTKEPFQLSQFEYLLSKKFDVFGLIEAGLAEPVTEDFNPYK